MVLSKFFNPKNDVSCKKIFGSEKNKDILIHFINDILRLKGEDTIEHVECFSPVQGPDIAPKKQAIIGILCRDRQDMQIIVEMQASPQQGFEKRAQYYAAKAYTRQLDQGQDIASRYHNLTAVILIAISDYVLFPGKAVYLSEHKLLDQDTYAHDLRYFHFVFLALSKFYRTAIGYLHSMVEKWVYFFKHGAQAKEQQVATIAESPPVVGKPWISLTNVKT